MALGAAGIGRLGLSARGLGTRAHHQPEGAARLDSGQTRVDEVCRAHLAPFEARSLRRERIHEEILGRAHVQPSSSSTLGTRKAVPARAGAFATARSGVEGAGRAVRSQRSLEIESVQGGLHPLGVEPFEGGHVIEDPLEVISGPFGLGRGERKPSEGGYVGHVGGGDPRHGGDLSTHADALADAGRMTRPGTVRGNSPTLGHAAPDFTSGRTTLRRPRTRGSVPAVYD